MVRHTSYSGCRSMANIHIVQNMIVSRQLRKKNIIEYLLYMWQVEDLLRGAQLDADALATKVLAGAALPQSTVTAWREWYSGLADMMRLEGVTETGHLGINNSILQEITELHKRLLELEAMEQYKEKYYKALPFIVEFRGKSGKKDCSEIESGLDFLYEIWLLKLQKRKISDQTQKVIDAIGGMLSMLAGYFVQYESGELDFDELE